MGSEIHIGQTISGYRVLRKLGEGSFGAVYQAWSEQLDRYIAIKVLHPHVVAENPELVARFLNEARAPNKIRHPGVVQVFEYNRLDDGTTYMVMEFLEGASLRQRVPVEKAANGTLVGTGAPLGQPAIVLTRQLALVLAAAHKQGMVHRDLKPENVMVVPDDALPGGERAKVLDFGLVKMVEQAQREGQGVMTGTKQPWGSPPYMAFEQYEGMRRVDAKADVYSLGVMFYEMLVGSKRFWAMLPQIGPKILKPQPLHEIDPRLAGPLEKLAEGMLAPVAADRPNMSDVASALEQLWNIAPTPPSAVTPVGAGEQQIDLDALPPTPPWRRILVGGGVLLVGVLAVGLVTRTTPGGAVHFRPNDMGTGPKPPVPIVSPPDGGNATHAAVAVVPAPGTASTPEPTSTAAGKNPSGGKHTGHHRTPKRANRETGAGQVAKGSDKTNDGSSPDTKPQPVKTPTPGGDNATVPIQVAAPPPSVNTEVKPPPTKVEEPIHEKRHGRVL